MKANGLVIVLCFLHLLGCKSNYKEKNTIENQLLGTWLLDSVTTAKKAKVKNKYIQRLTFKRNSSYFLYSAAYDMFDNIEGKYSLIPNPENKAKILLILTPQFVIINADDTVRQHHVYDILRITNDNLSIKKETQFFSDSLPIVFYNRLELYRKSK